MSSLKLNLYVLSSFILLLKKENDGISSINQDNLGSNQIKCRRLMDKTDLQLGV